jgi:hypothetical protein
MIVRSLSLRRRDGLFTHSNAERKCHLFGAWCTDNGMLLRSFFVSLIGEKSTRLKMD